MAIYRQGDMFDVVNTIDHFVITTNAIVKRNGALVMGAGIAKRVRDDYPGSDLALGELVEQTRNEDGVYGYQQLGSARLAAFQVKRHWGDKADLDLIRISAIHMDEWAYQHPDHTYALNFPGIGNGGLDYADVKPILDEWLVQDNIQVWTFN